METIFIQTTSNVDRLMAMMYMDFDLYVFEKRKDGILIHVDEENEASLEAFARRFTTWFTKAAFLENGEQYFENHLQQERWDIWKRDERFVAAYCDDLFKATTERRWFNFLLQVIDFDGLRLELEDLINDAYEMTEIRMNLIDEHFSKGVHEDYIQLRMNHLFDNQSLAFHNS